MYAVDASLWELGSELPAEVLPLGLVLACDHREHGLDHCLETVVASLENKQMVLPTCYAVLALQVVLVLRDNGHSQENPEVDLEL